MPYTKEEAKARIPKVLREVALLAIDSMMQLDKYPLNSRAFEKRFMALSGYIGHLTKLFYTVIKAEVNEKLATQ